MNRFITVASRAGLIIVTALLVLSQNTYNIQADEEKLDGHFNDELMFSEVYTIFLGLDNPIFSIESSTDGSKSIKNQYGDMNPEIIIESIDKINSENSGSKKLIKFTIDDSSLQDTRIELNFPPAIITIADEVSQWYLDEDKKDLPADIPNLIDQNRRLNITFNTSTEGQDAAVAADVSSGTLSSSASTEGQDAAVAADVSSGTLSSSASTEGQDAAVAADVSSGTLSSSASTEGQDAAVAADVSSGTLSSSASTEGQESK